MTAEQIADRFVSALGEKIRAVHAPDKHPRVHVESPDWRAVAEFAHDDPQLSLDWLANLSGIDYAADQKLCVCYDLWSSTLKHQFAIKVFCPRETPAIATVVDLWPAANWHEREAFDLLGIGFIGHPDLRRILCSDDWVGHPLRKDYEFPREYHGIPGSVEIDWRQGG